jgi:hypothetical protein
MLRMMQGSRISRHLISHDDWVYDDQRPVFTPNHHARARGNLSDFFAWSWPPAPIAGALPPKLAWRWSSSLIRAFRSVASVTWHKTMHALWSRQGSSPIPKKTQSMWRTFCIGKRTGHLNFHCLLKSGVVEREIMGYQSSSSSLAQEALTTAQYQQDSIICKRQLACVRLHTEIWFWVNKSN